jgi:hypothetical protein
MITIPTDIKANTLPAVRHPSSIAIEDAYEAPSGLISRPTPICKDFGRTNYSENFGALPSCVIAIAHLVLVISVRKVGGSELQRNIYYSIFVTRRE